MFSVVCVPDQAANLYEQLGTKPKFWFSNEESVDCLFKEVQGDTGEDWSEKIASELCELLKLPHAQYDLATWRDKRGVVSPTFVPSGGRLVLGNELLARVDSQYPARRFFRVSQHTLRRVLGIVRQTFVNLPIEMSGVPGVETAVDVFVGYLMLDAWIANQDRHHENWAVIVTPERNVHLAPTYDHASSLGRNETDQSRKDRLTTRDRGRSMERYVERTDRRSSCHPPTRSRYRQ